MINGMENFVEIAYSVMGNIEIIIPNNTFSLFEYIKILLKMTKIIKLMII